MKRLLELTKIDFVNTKMFVLVEERHRRIGKLDKSGYKTESKRHNFYRNSKTYFRANKTRRPTENTR